MPYSFLISETMVGTEEIGDTAFCATVQIPKDAAWYNPPTEQLLRFGGSLAPTVELKLDGETEGIQNIWGNGDVRLTSVPLGSK
jgi:hypothetical protein